MQDGLRPDERVEIVVGTNPNTSHSTAAVMVMTDTMAKIAGSVWLTVGVAVLVILKTRGRRAILSAESL